METLECIHITAVGAYAPQLILTNEELATKVDTSDEWIRSHTGIGKRHIARKEETSSDMAVQAVRDLTAKFDVDLLQIDGIIVATATPDFLGFPSTACLVQQKLGLQTFPAFDVSAGCTGFIFALETARGMIATGTMSKVLVIGTEKLSSIVDWEDRNTCVLFGDGAGCVLLERTQEKGGILDCTLGSQGSGSAALAVTGEKNAICMDGRAVYAFAVQSIGETIKKLLADNNLTIEEITWIVPHQANERIISACAKRFSLPQEKFFLNIEAYANTSAASIPIALSEMVEKDLIQPGNMIILIGFGAGLTYGGTLLTW
ncbi:beta-ketoacyl-ACP synthase III [uncultured Sphaerochaeta sp.]|uniref:beta-ketoacyl-ACP synthase III n=1 Tax=uncultured Sphaerochaeta sp. TaxID=886478 RepID=UPI002A0A2C49|nr:beta-ketoacyl-ACP synthase III [uncultured Sphaerochaeta sp.]